MAMADMITTRAMPDGTRIVSRKSDRIMPSSSRAYEWPTARMTQ